MIDQCTLNTDNAGLVKQRMVCTVDFLKFCCSNIEECCYQVLDDVTLVNLDVLDPNGRCAGTLLDKLDNCSTAFGEYLLKCLFLCFTLTVSFSVR